MKKKTEKKLSGKQRKFISKYLVSRNATQAAKKAGYSKKTAYSIGNENLKKPAIKEAIEKSIEKQEKRTLVDADYVINGLKETHELAKRAGEYGPAIQGLKHLGDHLDLFKGARGEPVLVTVLLKTIP